MAKTPLTFGLYYIGAMTFWILAGFKGKISDYLPEPSGQSNKKFRTLVAGFLVYISMLWIIGLVYGYYQSNQQYTIPGLTPEQTKEALKQTNGGTWMVIKPGQLDDVRNKLDSIDLDSADK
ncbi:MAG: hypothetical protein RIB86_23675 [Imperialibacter sp.]